MSLENADSLALVCYERPGAHVALVTLNRPKKRNAVNAALAQALEAALLQSEADVDVRVVLLASSSHVFCAGADLGAVAAGEAAGINTNDGGFAGLAYATRRKPWIAVVEGPALAGGFEICLACDMIVASTTASFGVPEVSRGLLPGAGGAHCLAQRIARNVATEIILTGAPIDAQRGFSLGLVNRLAAPGQALSVALELAASIAANAPLAVQYSLDLVRRSAACDDAAGRAMSEAALAELRRSEDYQEGIRAFVEKRAPMWKGQ